MLLTSKEESPNETYLNESLDATSHVDVSSTTMNCNGVMSARLLSRSFLEKLMPSMIRRLPCSIISRQSVRLKSLSVLPALLISPSYLPCLYTRSNFSFYLAPILLCPHLFSCETLTEYNVRYVSCRIIMLHRPCSFVASILHLISCWNAQVITSRQVPSIASMKYHSFCCKFANRLSFYPPLCRSCSTITR
jgi:hypothetical protein